MPRTLAGLSARGAWPSTWTAAFHCTAATPAADNRLSVAPKQMERFTPNHGINTSPAVAQPAAAPERIQAIENAHGTGNPLAPRDKLLTKQGQGAPHQYRGWHKRQAHHAETAQQGCPGQR